MKAVMQSDREFRTVRRKWLRPLLGLVVFLLGLVPTLAVGQKTEMVGPDKVMPRRPVAVEFTPGADRVLVANRRSGTLSVVDMSRSSVVAESRVAGTIGDLQALNNTGRWVVSDSANGQLIIVGLKRAGSEAEQGRGTAPAMPSILQAVETVRFPTVIDVDRSADRLAVAGYWSRCIAFHEIEPDGELSDARRVSLPFVPGDLAWVRGKLVVTAAFEPRIAVIDGTSSTVHLTRIPDHRLARIAPTPDRNDVWISSSRVNPLARSNRNDVHWGLMISNRIGIISDRQLAGIGAQTTFDDYRLVGDTGDAKGDPGDIAFGGGYQIIALEGVNQIAIASDRHDAWAYLDVGARPFDIAISKHTAVVANMLDDSISVVRLDTLQHVQTIMLGPARDETIVDRGERLFFDARQSHDGWMSCHTCHVEGHTNHLLNDNFSDSSFGTPKLVISLLGHAATAPFAWDGSRPNLETQIRNSLVVTMQADEPPTDEAVAALVAYVNQLPAPPISVATATTADQLADGAKLFDELGCIECHTPPNFTTSETFDVGLEDERGKRAFNPPSLIAVGWRARFFHDGRANSLEEIIDRYRHQLKRDLGDEERQSLLQYLRSL